MSYHLEEPLQGLRALRLGGLAKLHAQLVQNTGWSIVFADGAR